MPNKGAGVPVPEYTLLGASSIDVKKSCCCFTISSAKFNNPLFNKPFAFISLAVFSSTGIAPQIGDNFVAISPNFDCNGPNADSKYCGIFVNCAAAIVALATVIFCTITNSAAITAGPVTGFNNCAALSNFAVATIVLIVPIIV